jgi:hypothetical protein
MDKLIDYLPSYYKDIKEFQLIMSVETEEFEQLKTEIENLFNDQFIMTAREPAIARREKIFKIQADPSIETLEFRRKRIINRQSIKPPFTRRYLQKQLDFLLGTGVAVVEVDAINFIVYVKLAIADAPLFKEVVNTIEAIVPLNMVYVQKTVLNHQVRCKESIIANPLSRQMKLGSTWRLGITPFAISAGEVILK